MRPHREIQNEAERLVLLGREYLAERRGLAADSSIVALPGVLARLPDFVLIGESGSGEASVEAARELQPDLVLMDIHLPGIDGPALFAWMESEAPHHCSRTAFVTGDTLGEHAGRFLDRVQRPVLEKPFIPDEVRRVVEALREG